MKTKKIIMSLLVPFLAFLIILTLHNLIKTTPEAATTKETYLIVRHGLEGIEGTAKDHTGVYITKGDLNGLEIYTGDLVEVTFADYETILKVEKVN